jgi:hypothetical protein
MRRGLRVVFEASPRAPTDLQEKKPGGNSKKTRENLRFTAEPEKCSEFSASTLRTPRSKCFCDPEATTPPSVESGVASKKRDLRLSDQLA